MKKLFFLLFAFPLLFISCSDNDDDDHPIVGVWEFTSYEYIVETDNTELKKLIIADIEDSFEEETAQYLGSTYNFRNDNKLCITVEELGELPTVNYTIKGDVLTVSFNGQVSSSKFRIEGNKLHFVDDLTQQAIKEYITDGPFSDATITKVEISEVAIRK